MKESVRFNPYAAGFAEDPYSQYKRLREHDPVHRSFMGAWVLTRHEDVNGVLKDSRFSSELTRWEGFRRRYSERRSVAWLLSRSVLNLDPPDHTRVKRALTSVFASSRRDDLTEVVTEAAWSQVEAIRANGPTFDAIGDFALPVPVNVVSHLYGLTEEEQATVKGWSVEVSQLIEPLPDGSALDDAEDSIATFKAYLDRRMRTWAQPDSLPAGMVNKLQEGEIDRDEALANLILMFPAGHETTINLIGNGLNLLLSHPDQMALLRERSELMTSAIEEILRLEPPQQVAWRSALEDCDIGGRHIRAGEQLMLLIGAANRDPDAFEDAERFDITRQRNGHLSFGVGRHACLGAWFARLQGRIALSVLLEAFPQMQVDGPREWCSTLSFHGLKTLPVRMDRGDAPL